MKISIKNTFIILTDANFLFLKTAKLSILLHELAVTIKPRKVTICLYYIYYANRFSLLLMKFMIYLYLQIYYKNNFE
jgi:hypothetical protein